MKALVKDNKERGFIYKEIEYPSLGDNDVLIKVKAAAICGTDLLFYEWGKAADVIVQKLPFIPGHECAGVVEDKGRNVTRFKKGDHVSVDTHIPCGTCFQCRNGMMHICKNLLLFGHHVDGCFAEFAKAPSVSVRRIPDILPFEMGALLEPMGISLRGVLAGDVAGESVVVIGCGPVGLFIVGLSKYFGASRIIAADINANRLSVAERMGATRIINVTEEDEIEAVISLTDGDGAGVIIEASGSSEAFNRSFKYLRKGGKLILVGNAKEELKISNPLADLMHKEITMRAFHGREMYATWEKAESILLSGRFDVSPLITHRYKLSEFEKGFEACLSGEACKVIFTF